MEKPLSEQANPFRPYAKHTHWAFFWWRLAALVMGSCFCSVSAQGQNLVTNVAVGNGAAAISLDLALNDVFVTNSENGSISVINGSTDLPTTVAVGSNPSAIATDAATHKTYVANAGSSSVTIVDDITSATTTVAVGNSPGSIGINALTNKIYVANSADGTVTSIDGASGTTSAIAVGNHPIAIGVDAETNKIYVANFNDNSVTVIDGGTGSTSTIAVGNGPETVAVNPVTNMIYVANSGGNTVSAINGSSGAVTSVAVGNGPDSIAIDPVTNQIFVGNGSGNSLTIISGASLTTTTVSVGQDPTAVGVNTLTNQIYVVNANDGTITNVDGTSGASSVVTVGISPRALVVDPITNRIFVVNEGSNSLSIVDGATYHTANVATDVEPFHIAVNVSTGMVYVANQESSDVTAINPQTYATSTVQTGAVAHGLVVNPFTNKIYVIDNSSNVTVIDGATNATTTFNAGGADSNSIAIDPVRNVLYVGNATNQVVTAINCATGAETTIPVPADGPNGIAVNTVTNKIYVSNLQAGTLTIIDGSSDKVTATITVGMQPEGVAVNPATNKIYVTNWSSNFLTILDGTTNTPINVTIGEGYLLATVDSPSNKVYLTDQVGHVTVIDGASNVPTLVESGSAAFVSVNSASNKAYVANYGNNNVGVIDGATGATITSVNSGVGPIKIAINPVTNTIYSANYGDVAPPVTGNTVTAIAEQQIKAQPFSVSISPLGGGQTSNPAQQFVVNVQGAFSPNNLPAQFVYVQLDSCQKPWTRASAVGSTFAATVSGLLPGIHVVYAYADAGQDCCQYSGGGSLVSAVAAYPFLVTVPLPGAPSITAQPASQTVNSGQSVAFSVTSSGSPTPTFQWFLNGNPLSNANGISGVITPTLFLNGAADVAGTYSCVITNSAGSVVSNAAMLTIQNQSPPSRLIDISARAFVGTGANVLIAGYVVEGATRLPVLLRSSGPALSVLDVTGTLPDPELQLYSGSTVIDSNAGWQGNAQISATAAAVGAFNWQNPSSKDSALLETQSPGAFTAITSGLSGDTGVALAEVYDATPSGTWNAGLSKLGDISARSFVGTGANVLIGGFVIGGPGAETVLVRASGPALGALGVARALPDPELQLYSGTNVIASNTVWGGYDSIVAASSLVGAFSWNDAGSADSAILVTLAPGAYTAVVSGASGDTGVALVEIYDVP
jgi:YVTN family beta-propeller protein